MKRITADRAALVERKLVDAGKLLASTEYQHRTNQSRVNELLAKGVAATPAEARELVALLRPWDGQIEWKSPTTRRERNK